MIWSLPPVLGSFWTSEEHLATRELHLAAIPTFAMLCDIFIVIAPSQMDDDIGSRMSAHFSGGFLVRDLGERGGGFLGHALARLVELRPFCRALVDNCPPDHTRLVQSRVSVEARQVRCAQPLHLRFLRRPSAARHAGDGADRRPERFLGRVPMLFRAARRVRDVRPPETTYSHSRRVCPLPENVAVH